MGLMDWGGLGDSLCFSMAWLTGFWGMEDILPLE